MKIVMIHGQNHEGNTCMVARTLAEKIKLRTESSIQEFFLPKDFGESCLGCYSCLFHLLKRQFYKADKKE